MLTLSTSSEETWSELVGGPISEVPTTDPEPSRYYHITARKTSFRGSGLLVLFGCQPRDLFGFPLRAYR